MFITNAYAQAGAPAGPSGGLLEAFIPIILIFVIFYFLLIRPQQKKMKKHREMVNALQKGDKVLSSGGIYGVVTKVINDQEVMVEIADNVEVRMARMTISDILSKPTASQTTSSESSVPKALADKTKTKTPLKKKTGKTKK